MREVKSLDKFLGFLSPEKRKAIYLFVAALTGIAVVFGVVSQSDIDKLVISITSILDLLAALMAAANTNKSTS